MPLDFDHVFLAQRRSDIHQFLTGVMVDHDLHDPFPVAQVDKDQLAQVPDSLHPAVKKDVLVQVLAGNVATIISSFFHLHHFAKNLLFFDLGKQVGLVFQVSKFQAELLPIAQALDG